MVRSTVRAMVRAMAPAATSTSPSLATLLQHSVALDSDILDEQQTQQSDGGLIGWVTDIPPGGSLINIETIACEVLGLGARANSLFEPGVAPLRSDPSGYSSGRTTRSARWGLRDRSRYMTRGPGFVAPPGNYVIDYRLRAP